jgi:hypothetical protein
MTERRGAASSTRPAAVFGGSSLLVVWMTIMMMTSSSPSASFLVAPIGVVHGYNIPRVSTTPKLTNRAAASATTFLEMVNPEEQPDPTTFREAEVLGLRLMQEGNFGEALVGT